MLPSYHPHDAVTRLRLTEQVCYLVITPMTAATRLRLTEQVRGVLYSAV